MNLKLVTIIAMCVGLGYGIPQSLEGSQAVFKINGSCSTPAGKPGRCISIYSCSQISNKLQNPPISEETIALVKSSICKSPVERSVCCETSIGEERVEGSCQAEMTAYPPDPSSACCGEDTVPVSKLTSVGGLPTPIDAHPWAVIIEYIRVKNKQTGLYCGGALISGKYVLTAAHCIAGPFMEIATPKVVRLGEYDLTQEGQDCVREYRGDPMECTDGALRITIEKTIPHPEYTPKISKKNDIGLIRLQETAPYTDFIRPICLPTKDLTQPENMPVNFTMFAVGWGATKTRFQSTIKLQVEVPFVSQEKCQPAYNTAGRRATLGRGQLCAGGVRDVDTCRGDSGGPLVYENWNWTEHTGGVVKRSQLTGIVSFGPNPCGEKDVPGIYTNVYEYLDWIRSVIVS